MAENDVAANAASAAVAEQEVSDLIRETATSQAAQELEIFDIIPKFKYFVALARDRSEDEPYHERLNMENGFVRVIDLQWDTYSEGEWEKLDANLPDTKMQKVNRRLPARLRQYRTEKCKGYKLSRTDSKQEDLSKHAGAVGFSELPNAVAGIGIVYRIKGNPVIQVSLGEKFKLLARDDRHPEQGLEHGTIFCADPASTLEVLGKGTSDDEVSILMFAYGLVKS